MGSVTRTLTLNIRPRRAWQGRPPNLLFPPWPHQQPGHLTLQPDSLWLPPELSTNPLPAASLTPLRPLWPLWHEGSLESVCRVRKEVFYAPISFRQPKSALQQ